jgi:hypothetical protein
MIGSISAVKLKKRIPTKYAEISTRMATIHHP